MKSCGEHSVKYGILIQLIYCVNIFFYRPNYTSRHELSNISKNNNEYFIVPHNNRTIIFIVINNTMNDVNFIKK